MRLRLYLARQMLLAILGAGGVLMVLALGLDLIDSATDLLDLGGWSALGRYSALRLPLIGVGGIETADDAYLRIRAGASAVQVYTAMVYEGPNLAHTIATGLVRLLKENGYSSLEDAIGAAHR